MILIRSIVEVGSSRRGRWYVQDTDVDIPSGLDLRKCVDGQWTSAPISANHPPYPYRVKTSFELPISAETLFLISSGALQSGSLQISTSSAVSDVAQVNITVHYFKEDILARAKVCEAERKSGEHGVGIFTPRQWWGDHSAQDQLYIEINLTFPNNKTRHPLYINNFETDLHNYLHRVVYNENLVQFGSLSLMTSNQAVIAKDLNILHAGSVRSSNGLISIESFTATNSNIRTSNGPILGTYNATSSLTLRTSNAPIQVTVNLENSNGSADLELKTSNGRIDSKINLLMSQKLRTGDFKVSTSSSNQPLKIDMASIPLDSTLFYDGYTSNAKAELWLAPSFEGKISLATSNNKPSLHVTEDVKDPAGRGRVRTIRRLSNKAGFLEGFVSWDDQAKEGHAKLHSSNAPVLLYL